MKVIDEKGKLFGRLNIIDLIVIVVVIAALAVVGIKFLGSGEDSAPVTNTRLTYTVRVTAQNAQLADYVAEYVDTATGKRDQLMASGALQNAYIVDFWTEATQYHVMSNGGVEVLDAEAAAEAGLVDICFVIEATVTDTLKNEVGTQEVRVGRTHNVKTTHLEFPYGIVESCTWEPVA